MCNTFFNICSSFVNTLIGSAQLLADDVIRYTKEREREREREREYNQESIWLRAIFDFFTKTGDCIFESINLK